MDWTSYAELEEALGAVARVVTDRPARYGKQLASHMGRKLEAAWDEEAGTGSLLFNRDGVITGFVGLACEPGALVMTLHAAPGHLERLEDVAGIHLARFGRKDGLVVTWQRDDGTTGTTQGPITDGE